MLGAVRSRDEDIIPEPICWVKRGGIAVDGHILVSHCCNGDKDYDAHPNRANDKKNNSLTEVDSVIAVDLVGDFHS